MTPVNFNSNESFGTVSSSSLVYDVRWVDAVDEIHRFIMKKNYHIFLVLGKFNVSQMWKQWGARAGQVEREGKSSIKYVNMKHGKLVLLTFDHFCSVTSLVLTIFIAFTFYTWNIASLCVTTLFDPLKLLIQQWFLKA